MLYSIALILLLGMLGGFLVKKLHLPSLLGMLVVGIIIGPYVLNLLDVKILDISAELRKIALIIILIRAGLSLNIDDLKKVGRPAILMCFIPACFEIIGMVLLAPLFLHISYLDAAIMGAVVGAVSPAVIVPKMLKLMEEGYGRDKGIPPLILAGASVDDVFVIVMFTAFTGLAAGDGISVMSFVNIPISIILGIVVGVFIGLGLALLFSMVKINDIIKVIIFISIAFLLTAFEDNIKIIPFASLLAVMAMGVSLARKRKEEAVNLASKFNSLWVAAEIFLFVLVGASVNIDYALDAGLNGILLIFSVLVFRMVGVYLCLLFTNLNQKERLFCMIAYTPKATVQAAIGGVALQMGLPCGEIVLTMAVLAILITAPLGAFMIELTYKKLLNKDNTMVDISN